MKKHQLIYAPVVIASTLLLSACGEQASNNSSASTTTSTAFNAENPLTNAVTSDETKSKTTALTTTTTVDLINHPGKLLASNCFQCHGTDGRNGQWDSLAGESASEISKELAEMGAKSGGIMNVHAMAYTPEEANLIGDYFSKVK